MKKILSIVFLLGVFIFPAIAFSEEPAERPKPSEPPPAIGPVGIDQSEPEKMEIEPISPENPETKKNQEDPQNNEYLPINYVNPRYPMRAQQHLMAGRVLLQYNVDSNGNPKDIKILIEEPADYGFGKAALKAAEKYRYSPRIIDGDPVEVLGVRAAIYFSIGEGAYPLPFNDDEGLISGENLQSQEYYPIIKSKPWFPIKAEKKGVDGLVVLKYTVTSKGTVKEVMVLKENPKGYGFGNAAVNAIKKYRYRPRVINGKAVDVDGVENSITFCQRGSQSSFCSP